MNIFLDTSALMQCTNTIEKLIEDNKIVICSIVLEELDNLKTNKDEAKAFKARQAIKFIEKHADEIEFILRDIDYLNILSMTEFDPLKNDNKILATCYKFNEQNKDVKLLTYDICLKLKAEFIGLSCLSIKKKDEEEVYKGYVEISGTSEENDYKLLELSSLLHPNEYVIVHDTDTDEYQAVKWRNGSYHDVYYSKAIKPKNLPQSCAIDLMYDRNIPVKIICGGYGAGN